MNLNHWNKLPRYRTDAALNISNAFIGLLDIVTLRKFVTLNFVGPFYFFCTGNRKDAI